ncbi:MAG TPA: MFS transporter, partial [Burkholderiales bacterium]|nr:MFS transporter [Burkholderiales bacterium]
AMPVSYRLGAFYFLFFAGAGLWVAYLPPYFAARGLGAAEIAWVLALPQLARIVAPTVWATIADRFAAQRAIVVLSCGAGIVCYSLFPVVSGFAGFAWVMGLTSLLGTAALPLVESITLGALAGQTGRYGPIRLWGSIGFMIAVFAGGVWLDFESTQALPYAMLVFVGAALLVGLTLPSPALRTAVSGPLAINSAAVLLLGSAFFMAVAHGTLYAFFTLHLQRLGYEGSLIGFLWMLGVLGEIGVFLFLPAFFRRFDLSTILVASAACGVARFLAIGWAADWLIVLLAAQLLHAATFGSFHAAAVAAVHRVFPPQAQARGQSLFSSIGYGAGGALGAVTAGWAWEAAGPGFAFTVSSVAAAAGLLFAYPLKRKGL